MAVPIAPSGLSLIQEGMKKALGRAASSGEQARALDFWIDEIKNDIWMDDGGSHELLEAETFLLLTEGKHIYTLATDFDAPKQFIILDGDVRDTARNRISGAYTGSAITVTSDNLQDGNLTTAGWNQASLTTGSFIRFNLNDSAGQNFTKIRVYLQATGADVTYSIGYSSTGGGLGNYSTISDTFTVGTDDTWHEFEWTDVGYWQYWAIIVNGTPSGAGNVTEVQWLSNGRTFFAGDTIRLASTDSSESEGRVGKEIVLISGTGSGQKRQIVAFDTTTKVASVNSAWSIVPDSTTGYLLVSEYHPLPIIDQNTFAKIEDRTHRDRPESGMVWNDSLYVQKVPDKTYPLVYQYWVNPLKVDTADTNATHQQIMANWRSLFVEGVFVRTLQNEDDTRANSELLIYRDMISKVTHQAQRTGRVEPHGF